MRKKYKNKRNSKFSTLSITTNGIMYEFVKCIKAYSIKYFVIKAAAEFSIEYF